MSTFDAMTIGDVLAYLTEHGFTGSPSKRVHHHQATGARVVIDKTDPVDLTVHAYSGLWRAQLTRVPFTVFTATITAVTDRARCVDRKDDAR